MTLRLASWNINSVRIRLPLIQAFSQQIAPDVLCLQETKVEDSLFPLEALHAMGYAHVQFSGQKGYNGVAVLSRRPIDLVECQRVAGSEDKRHIAVRLDGGIELHNFYVPAGGDVPDPEQNPAYGFKLRFVEAMQEWSARAMSADRKLVILGDFNIAPGEHDVWSHKQLRDVVSHTEPEITRLCSLRDRSGWCDAGRYFVPESEKLYTWWSYRNRDWVKSNRGRRLDHIWVSPALKSALRSYGSLPEARSWQQPSDHVPVWIDVALQYASF